MRKQVIESTDKKAAVNLALDTISMQKQAIIFVNSKPSAEKTAEDLARKIGESRQEWEKLAEKAGKALSKPTKQCERLAFCLKKGIAFHHAGLVAKQRELIEENFRNGAIKIICATPTLAYGVDLPAFRAIIKDLKRYGFRGMDWIPVLEYLQQAGRAGRPRYDSYGEAIAIAATKADRDFISETYINGEPEAIYSKLAVEPVLRTYTLSLIASGFVTTKKGLVEFFNKTFWAHQYTDSARLQAIIEKMLGLLQDWEFLKSRGSQDEFVSADELDENVKLRATPLGKRVAELYLDPLTAHDFIEAMKRATSVKADEFSYLQTISSTLELRPLLRARISEEESLQEAVLKYNDSLLVGEPGIYDDEYSDFLAGVKTALFFLDWINEAGEEALMEKFNIRPGEIHVKRDRADWLLFAMTEIARILEFREQARELNKLRMRVKAGVKEELLLLLRFRGIGRVRARTLFNNRIRTAADVKKADLKTLQQLIGVKLALSVKEQVGQEVEEVKKGKRRGQLSVNRFNG
ncbi:hypothetical protein J4475_01640 [Candidatus Woesearchaeota archaeon]|nr:hypothetical protein [Candidatus Woesearchaeota archaeon]